MKYGFVSVNTWNETITSNADSVAFKLFNPQKSLLKSVEYNQAVRLVGFILKARIPKGRDCISPLVCSNGRNEGGGG